ncbi:amyloid fiber anchoring/assembly protein TapA [Neobacillus vireti]|uniref:Amyloid fiber anchoring/assembly protein TapA n=1 Tax=Neobacillus vireti LMG 21834 TaxID=1131730 RepID=A0AB94IMU3_9BACI|nr:amyloid fiber anchoring/assembly protein TapA [Neobacillus vireti]ETI68436.1 hypothetical protein BAVI_12529 [Neobacillus vireti LMG 21834]KLT17262.1 hypothetical protein AA980_15385 [Neobacillus vireti]
MIRIRYSRLKRLGKKDKKIKLASQILAIWYLLLFTVGYLSSDTGAYFNSSSQISGAITAGTWQELWDKSSLKFKNGENENSKKVKDQMITNCDVVEITAAIQNVGNDMKGQSQFEVFYNESKNPKDGQKIGEGNIEPLKSGELAILKYSVNNPGNYKFKALQRPGHANKYETRQELWSETITVKCQASSKSQNEEKSTSQTQEVIIPENKKNQSTEGTKDKTQQSSNEDSKEVPPSNEQNQSKQSGTEENHSLSKFADDGSASEGN